METEEGELTYFLSTGVCYFSDGSLPCGGLRQPRRAGNVGHTEWLLLRRSVPDTYMYIHVHVYTE